MKIDEVTTTNTSEPKTVRLNTNVIRKVEELAKVQNRNFSNMVETLLMKATEQGNQQISI